MGSLIKDQYRNEFELLGRVNAPPPPFPLYLISLKISGANDERSERPDGLNADQGKDEAEVHDRGVDIAEAADALREEQPRRRGRQRQEADGNAPDLRTGCNKMKNECALS